ncbi:hypothetical protein IC619_012375 [Hazenella sp. IB182353]|uniref:hypothetical protein n=1 Tax=Polycladospora coralii TaxID=2771432 RepID=UPI0017471476|nr:hypothetical protein [Polycladospora coralii]MBS7531288.1 hypothetical protein [Polycladospora coralii]
MKKMITVTGIFAVLSVCAFAFIAQMKADHMEFAVVDPDKEVTLPGPTHTEF